MVKPGGAVGGPETGEMGHQTDFFLSTPEPPLKGGGPGAGVNGEGVTERAPDSGAKKDDEGSGLNIGLIVGIAVSVLVAVVILCIALYKFRSRDEGTYKVDESQNFTALDGKKGGGSSGGGGGGHHHHGNGTLLSHSGGDTGGKGAGGRGTGKKKDVKEWYV
jgi:hypothetical protein